MFLVQDSVMRVFLLIPHRCFRKANRRWDFGCSVKDVVSVESWGSKQRHECLNT